jgi:hypothetical protein
MAVPPRRNLGPVPQFAERSNNTYDATMAEPSAHRGGRSGPLQAEEGIGWQDTYARSFAESVRDTDTGASHQAFEAQIAGQADGRSALASGRAVPAWNKVPEVLMGMFEGSSGDGGAATPFSSQVRPGYNRGTLSPTVGLLRGEREGQRHVAKIAENAARLRRNEADVTDAP